MLTPQSTGWASYPLCTSVFSLRGSSVIHGPGRPLRSHPRCCSLAARLGRSATQDRLTTALCRAGKRFDDGPHFTPFSWRDSTVSDSGAASAVTVASDTWGTESDEQDIPPLDNLAQQVQHPGSQPSNGPEVGIREQYLQQVPGAPTSTKQRDSQAQQQQQHAQRHEQQQRPLIPAVADVEFSIQQRVEYGQNIRVVGSAAALGSWNPSEGPDMTWHRHDSWTTAASLPVGQYEFKYLLVHRSGHLEWEPGSNRVFDVPSSPCQLQVQGHWGATGDTDVLILQQNQEQQQPSAEISQQSARQQPQCQHQQQQVKDPTVLDKQQQQQRGPGPAAPEQFLNQSAALPQTGTTDNNRGHNPEHAAAVLHQQPLSAVLLQASAAVNASVPVSVTGLSASQQQLVDELADQRQHLTKNIAEIATGVKEINIDLDLLHDDLAHITVERVLHEQQRQKGRRQQQQQQQQQGITPAGWAAGSDPGSEGDSGWSDVVSQALAKANSVYQQASPYRIKHVIKAPEGQPRLPPEEQASHSLVGLLAQKSGSSSSLQLGHLPGSGSSNGIMQPGHDGGATPTNVKGTSRSGMLVPRSSNGSQNNGTGERVPISTMASSNGSKTSHTNNQGTGNSSSSSAPVDVLHATAHQGLPAPVLSAGQGSPHAANLSSTTTGGTLSAVDPAAGLQCAVLSWRQELLSFRHDALLLQEELAAVEDSISSAQQQMAANRAAWAAPGGSKHQGSNGRHTTPDASSPAASAVMAAGSTASAAVDSMPDAQLADALVDPGSSEQLSTAASKYTSAANSPQAAAALDSHNDANAAAASAAAMKHSTSYGGHSSAPVAVTSNGSMHIPANDATNTSSAPAADSTESFTVGRPQFTTSDSSMGDSSGSEAPVADNVSDYQRLLRQRFHELADLIAADLASSAESLTEEAQHQRQQQKRELKLLQKRQQVNDEQQAGAAKFAAAHHAASAAYASGRTPAGDTSGGAL